MLIEGTIENQKYVRFLEELACHMTLAGRSWTNPEDIERMDPEGLLRICFNNRITLKIIPDYTHAE